MKAQTRNEQPVGWVLYDDSCGFCRRWVPYWKNTLQRRGLEIAPLQADWVAARLQVEGADLLSDLRLLKPDNSQIQGADVYRYAMRRIWWACPLYVLSITPGLRAIFNFGYRTFARHRYQVSRACHFEPRGGDRRL